MLDFSLEVPFSRMRRIRQLSASYCGPATLVMLFDNLGIYKSQEEVVEAAGVTATIDRYGMIVPELARAVKLLAPGVDLWFKQEGSVADLEQLTKTWQFPVGVEWQGDFSGGEGEDEGGEGEDDDPGHYSVVTAVEPERGLIRLADPYKAFAGRDRLFSLLDFEQRWWDVNEVKDAVSGRRKLVEDRRMMFILSSEKLAIFDILGLVQG